MKLALLLAGALISGPIPAWEQTGNNIMLSQTEADGCAREGGCVVMSKVRREADLLRFYQWGYDRGNRAVCSGA